MDVLRLLNLAEAAGLTVTRDGDQLHVRGPKTAAPLAAELGRYKAEILFELDSQAKNDGDPGEDAKVEWLRTFEFPKTFAINSYTRVVNGDHYRTKLLRDLLRLPSTAIGNAARGHLGQLYALFNGPGA